MEVQISKIDEIIEKNGLSDRWLIANMLDVQDEFQYLPREAMSHIAKRMQVPVIQVNKVAEFYKVFKLVPPGRHLISVCRGATCHVRGGEALIEQLGRLLDVRPGQTTRDKQFTLEVVNCLGCCALGRVIVIDGKYFVDVDPSEVENILNMYAGNGGNSHG